MGNCGGGKTATSARPASGEETRAITRAQAKAWLSGDLKMLGDVDATLQAEWCAVAGALDKELSCEKLEASFKERPKVKEWIQNLMEYSDESHQKMPRPVRSTCFIPNSKDTAEHDSYWARVVCILDQDGDKKVSWKEFHEALEFSVAIQMVFNSMDTNHDMRLAEKEFRKECAPGSDVDKALRTLFRPNRSGAAPPALFPGISAPKLVSSSSVDFAGIFWPTARARAIRDERRKDNEKHWDEDDKEWEAAHSVFIGHIAKFGIDQEAFMGAMQDMWRDKHEISGSD